MLGGSFKRHMEPMSTKFYTSFSTVNLRPKAKKKREELGVICHEYMTSHMHGVLLAQRV